MNKQTEEGLIGISIRENQLRMTEALTQGNQTRVVRVARGVTRFPFAFSILADRANIKSLAEDINRLYETTGFKSSYASLCLDSEKVLIKKIPVDSTLKDSEIKEHVYWEISQFMINPIESFVVDYEVLILPEHVAPENFVIVVVVRKALVDFLKEVFAATDLHLKAVDIDVFSAQRVLQETFTFSPESKVALVDIRKKNLQFSVLYQGFYLLQEVNYPLDEGFDVIANRDEHLARIISKELRRIILDHKLGKSVEDMQDIFLYGDGVENSIIEILSQAHNVNLQRINPFDKIPLSETPTDPEVSNNPEAYVTSVGVAIKGF